MSEKQIVYAVTLGEYGDYRIHSLHSDKTYAERVAAVLNADDKWADAGVEDWEIDWFTLVDVPEGMQTYCVDCGPSWNRASVMPRNDEAERQAAQYAKEVAVGGYYRTHLFARDEDHAAELGMARFAAYRARQEDQTPS